MSAAFESGTNGSCGGFWNLALFLCTDGGSGGGGSNIGAVRLLVLEDEDL